MPSLVHLSSKLEEISEASAVALQLKADHYFDAIRFLLDNFAQKKDVQAIYITATIPSKSIINALEVLEVNLNRVYFVDCVSSMMMSMGERHDRVIYLDSPSMLENLMLKIEYLTRRMKDEKVAVIIDSVNSLAIHNSPKMLSEWLHILTNHLRAKNAYTILFSMEDYSTDEIRNMIDLVCDETINLSSG